ncbi:hypothetical protein FK220_019955 [Flavobacteriaceae bacterium TP-CH-4]|uniref:Uncharacterized protein n=1 Tax=Pelagihabitans pacificus TaxID=2696054 RepID=A0A967AYV9_9FLAO|nr:hypothetical protein [Pelagihabitans pacificus]NHF61630.1 hypothetical protein [Pelagihabitans pacificus]
MKNLILNICLLFSILTFSQERAENELVGKTETDLLGYWEKLSEKQEEKKYYVEIQNGQLFLSTGKFEEGGLDFKVSDKILIEIIGENNIILKNFILENDGISKLILLDSKKLVLENGGEQFEFIKLK